MLSRRWDSGSATVQELAELTGASETGRTDRVIQNSCAARSANAPDD
ncbi:hypothetical protein [Streptomyces acidicola]